MANNNHFELTLDTLAPSGSISGLGEYEKENKDLVINGGDATFKKVWFDKVAAPTKESEGYLAAKWEAKDLAVKSAFAESGIYYYHLVLMDDVNNESEIYTLGPCHFDNVKPTASNFVISDSRGNTSNTKEVKLNYSFNYADAASGAARLAADPDNPFDCCFDHVCQLCVYRRIAYQVHGCNAGKLWRCTACGAVCLCSRRTGAHFRTEYG